MLEISRGLSGSETPGFMGRRDQHPEGVPENIILPLAPAPLQGAKMITLPYRGLYRSRSTPG